MTDTNQADTPVSQTDVCLICGNTRSNHNMGTGLAVCPSIAVPTFRSSAAAEQRGRLAERERCAGIAKTAWFVCALDVIMDADAAQQLCERTEQAILSAKDPTHG
jgi:hypothetical protein